MALTDYSTKTRAFIKDLLSIHDRPENQDIETPSTVDRLREWSELLRTARENRQTLQETYALMKEVNKDTKKSNNILKSLASIFKFGGKEMARHDE